MHKIQSLIPPDAVPGPSAHLRVLDEDECHALLAFTMMECGKQALPDEIEKQMLWQVLTKRLRWAGLNPDADFSGPMLALCLFVLGDGSLMGKTILWAYTLKRMHDDLGRQVTLADWASPKWFGMGVPTEKWYETCWVAQKGYSSGDKDVDNYIDSWRNWAAPGETPGTVPAPEEVPFVN